jgi:hypothetical protein
VVATVSLYSFSAKSAGGLIVPLRPSTPIVWARRVTTSLPGLTSVSTRWITLISAGGRKLAAAVGERNSLTRSIAPFGSPAAASR